MRGKAWTNEEDQLIRDNQHLSNEMLMEKVGTKSNRALRVRHEFLGIERPVGTNALARYRHNLLRESWRGKVPDDWFDFPSVRKDARDNKLQWYWQGTICDKCKNTTIRNASTGNCWPCFSALTSAAKKTPSGRKRSREYAEKYRKMNPTYKRDLVQRYKKEDPEKYRSMLERAREWRQRNKDYFVRHNRNWAQTNPDHRAQIKDARRARKLGAEVPLTKTEKLTVRAIKAKRRLLNQRAGREVAHVDHLLPLTQGGTNHPDNLQVISAKANQFWKDKVKCCPYPKPDSWNEPNWEVV